VIHVHQHIHCPSAALLGKEDSHIGACAFIHSFGSSLNPHVHFHACVVDGVFEAKEEGAQVIFHATKVGVMAILAVQDEARRRIVKAFVKRGF
jgi:hypothetical protein